MLKGGRLTAILTQIERERNPATGCTPCHYCGVPAWTIDHVVPRLMLDMIQKSEDETLKAQIRQRHKILTVSACGECNTLLGERYFPTLEKRKSWVRQRLRRRYRKFLTMPTWGLDELAALDGGLQDYILQGLAIKRHVLRRVQW